MSFIDELLIHINAGKGGDGVVRFRHEKGKEFGGPSGGDGGKGGDVYVRAVRDVHLLSKYRNKKEFSAQNGKDGGSNGLHGENGEDLIINLPIGSILTNTATNKKISLSHEGEEVLLLRGGHGGSGNESYKNSINQVPKKFTYGYAGEIADFFVEVELIADVGFIGLPNAGKSSLLNALTASDVKTADYRFTTLEPNLGAMHGFILCDIPGLIEGASIGKGLGHKFLRHIRRTKMLAHLISLENEDIVKTYNIIRNELKNYDESLINKQEIIILTKTDIITDNKQIDANIKKMKKFSDCVLTLSLFDDDAIKKVKDELTKILRSNDMHKNATQS